MSINDTINQRQQTHGSFIDNGRIMQRLKDDIRNFHRVGLGSDTPACTYERLMPFQREALDMIAHKIGRILSGNPDEPDHWHDIAGYATLVEKILKGEYK